MQKIIELRPDHSGTILKIINDAANAYKGSIPDDRWKGPYMSANELADEIGAGVRFYGWFEDGFLEAIAFFLVITITLCWCWGPLAVYAVTPRNFDRIFDPIIRFLNKHGSQLIAAVFFVIGIYLIARGVTSATML
jgi:hypothetical protein